MYYGRGVRKKKRTIQLRRSALETARHGIGPILGAIGANWIRTSAQVNRARQVLSQALQSNDLNEGDRLRAVSALLRLDALETKLGNKP